MTDETRARLLAALLAGAAVTHFVAPHGYDAIVPRWLPGPSRAWTLGSGAIEMASACAVALPATRRAGALAALVLFTAVFPANVQMAIDWHDESSLRRTAAVVRLPLQLPLLTWAWRVARSSGTVPVPQRPRAKAQERLTRPQ